MAEKEEQQKPPINHIVMTHTCAECEDYCTSACKGGICKITPKDTA